MYPCERVHTHVHKGARSRASARTHTHTQEHTFTHARKHARMRQHTHARTCSRSRILPHNRTYTHPPTGNPTLIPTLKAEAMPCFEECLRGRVGARTCACARMTRNAPQASCSHTPNLDIRTHPNSVVRSPDQRLATRATRPSGPSRDPPARKVAAGA